MNGARDLQPPQPSIAAAQTSVHGPTAHIRAPSTTLAAAANAALLPSADPARVRPPEQAKRLRGADRGEAASNILARPSRADNPFRRRVERVTLFAADGYALTGMHYTTAVRPRANLVVAGATGVPQLFYRRFAEFAASCGYSTLTLDYRGVGLSAPPTLKGFKVDYFDWGRLDLASAVDAMSSRHIPLYLVGHSYGGHAFGMLPNHDQVTAFYAFGTGAGWHGWMPPLERLKVLAMWHVLGPLLTTWKGYLPWSTLGMGEDLPLDFYRQWKRWCRYPNNFFGDPGIGRLVRGFDQVRVPLMAANSIDDRWSPPRSRDAFMAGYRNAAKQTMDIDPVRLGLKSIGHMGYFRPRAIPLWKSALVWFDDTTKSASKATLETRDAVAR